jgi:hypothetical protein
MSMYPPPAEGDSGEPAPYGQPAPPPYDQFQQAEYGRPQGHPQSGYPQQAPYGQVPQQGQPYPGAPGQDPAAAWGFTPPAPKSRKGLKIGLGIGAFVILAVGGVVAFAVLSVVKDTGKYKLVPPATFQGQVRDDNSAAVKSMSGSIADAAKTGVTPVVTTYATQLGATTPGFAFVGAYGDIPGGQFELNQFWTGAGDGGQATVSPRTNEPAGKLGGTLQCATLDYSGTYVPTCVWADNSSYGALMDFDDKSTTAITPTGLSALAAKTLALRDVTEVVK